MDLLWIHRAARCDCVVSWHDESALLEEHLWSDSERWAETLEVNETKSSLDEDLIVGLASILDCIFEPKLNDRLRVNYSHELKGKRVHVTLTIKELVLTLPGLQLPHRVG